MRWLDGITEAMDLSLSKLRVGDGQGGLACCSPWGRKELDMPERLNKNKYVSMCVYMYICVCAFTGIETYEDIYSQSLLFSESIFAKSPDH